MHLQSRGQRHTEAVATTLSAPLAPPARHTNILPTHVCVVFRARRTRRRAPHGSMVCSHRRAWQRGPTVVMEARRAVHRALATPPDAWTVGRRASGGGRGGVRGGVVPVAMYIAAGPEPLPLAAPLAIEDSAPLHARTAIAPRAEVVCLSRCHPPRRATCSREAGCHQPRKKRAAPRRTLTPPRRRAGAQRCPSGRREGRSRGTSR